MKTDTTEDWYILQRGSRYILERHKDGRWVRKRPAHARYLAGLCAEDRVLERIAGHPHVVQMVRADLASEDPYLTLAYVEGERLGERWWYNASTAQRLQIALQLVETVCNLHKLNVVHRDLKASNLLIGASDDRAPMLTVLDFELAIVDGRTQSSGGTLSSCAPELILLPHPELLDYRCDIFSLALLLRGLLLNLPHHLDAEGHWSVLCGDGLSWKPAGSCPLSPMEYNSLVSILSSMLCPWRNERVTDCTQLMELLQQMLYCRQHSADARGPERICWVVPPASGELPDQCRSALTSELSDVAPVIWDGVVDDLSEIVPFGTDGELAGHHIDEQYWRTWIRYIREYQTRLRLLDRASTPGEIFDAALLMLRAGMLKKALALCDTSMDLSADGGLFRAAAALEVGAVRSAREALEAVNRCEVSHVRRLHAAMAAVYARQGNVDAVLEHTQRTLMAPATSTDEDLSCWVMLFNALVDAGLHGKLVGVLGQLEDRDIPRSSACLLDVCKRRADNLASNAKKRASFTPVLSEVFFSALGSAETVLRLTQVQAALLVLGLRQRDLDREVEEHLISAAERLMILQPQDAVGYLARGFVAGRRSKFADALSYFKASRCRSPEVRQRAAMVENIIGVSLDPTVNGDSCESFAGLVVPLSLLGLDALHLLDDSVRCAMDSICIDNPYLRSLLMDPLPEARLDLETSTPPDRPLWMDQVSNLAAADMWQEILHLCRREHVDGQTPNPSVSVIEASALLSLDRIQEALSILVICIARDPTDITAWSLLLEIQLQKCGQPGDVGRHAERTFCDLLETLRDTGIRHEELLPWYLRLDALCGRPGRLVARLGEAAVERDLGWPLWLLGLEAWVSMGLFEDAENACEMLRRTGAPEDVLERAWALCQQVGR